MNKLYEEESSRFFAENIDDFNILLVTATKTEKQALHQCLKPIEGRDSLVKVSIDNQTYFLGIFGSYNVVHVACGEMGSIGRAASIITTKDAIVACKPVIVLMIGIAFGRDKTKQQIGDVLVSEKVTPYEPQRVGKDAIITRGNEGPASVLLLNRFKNVDDWQYSLAKRNAEVILGEVLTGEKLIDNPDLKAELMSRYPNAKGGEMEGAGIYAACDGYSNVHWILVKGICDYADGKKKVKKEQNQKTAIDAALSLCEHVFSLKHGFENIGVFSIGKSKKKELVNNLKKQVNRQLEKQINSEKYVRDTFIEIGDQKDHLRYVCDSVFYFNKYFGELKNLDFRYLNLLIQKKSRGQLSWNFELPTADTSSVNMKDYEAVTSVLLQYLSDKRQDVKDSAIDSSGKSTFERKIWNKMQEAEYLQARVAIITDNAGQGKTNFLCDFAENFLLNRNIPSLFLTGAELDADDIKQSILRKIFPDAEASTFAAFLEHIKSFCYSQNKFFVIVIDGINENLRPKTFSPKLEEFIAQMMEHEFIKVVLSCRTEYYEHNFKNLETSSFRSVTKKVYSSSNHRSDDDIKEKLFHTYIKHYEIGYVSFSDKAYNQLVGNFLLLRIFCETYKGQKLGNVDNIYKEELFGMYYKSKSAEINKRIIESDDLGVSANFDIKNFIQNIVSVMVREGIYANIPLDDIITTPKDRDLYTRFLDENILIRRDIEEKDKGLFSPSEVVNFTFDEFRDFLISDHLVNQVYKKSEAAFTDFIEKRLTSKSPLLEGCGTFLFFMARRRNDPTLSAIVNRQEWFDDTFVKNIFSLRDNQVTEEDKHRLKEHLLKGSYFSRSIIYNLIIRNDIDYYANLNAEFLFSFLRGLDESDYNKAFVRIFGDSHNHLRINQSSLLEQIDDILQKGELEKKDRYHRLFELLVYMLTNSGNWQVRDIYERYCFKYKKQATEQIKRALTSQNTVLIHAINLFVNNYATKLQIR